MAVIYKMTKAHTFVILRVFYHKTCDNHKIGKKRVPKLYRNGNSPISSEVNPGAVFLVLCNPSMNELWAT